MKNLNRQIFTGARGQTPGMCYPLNLRAWLVCVLSIILSPFILFAQAPAISYSSPQTYKVGTAISQLEPTSSGVAAVGYGNPVTFSSGFHGPDGLAVDAPGNLYVSSDSDGTVKKIPAGGGTPVVIGSGFNAPAGIAVDAAGNVYVADLGNKAIKKIPAGGGVPVTIGSGFYAPYDVAVDAAGNVYVANGGDLLELPAGGGAAVFLYGGTGSATAVETVTVDAAGNVYFGGDGTIYKMPAGSYTSSEFSGWNLQNIPSVAVNSAGNVYMAVATKSVVVEIPGGGGAFVTRISGYKINNIAMDAAGNIYACNPSSTDITEFKPTGGYCIHPVLPAGLNFDETTGIISGTPTEASPAANYAVTAYNSSGSNTATVNIAVDLPPLPTLSYSSPQTYTAGTAIAPLAPASSGVAALSYGYRNILASNLANPGGIATDAAGNVYVACYGDSTVKKFPAGGGAPVTLGSGFNQPLTVAVDAAGNVYVACYNDGTVKEIPAAGGAPLTLASGITSPNGIAVDAAGNVYVIAGSYNGTIYEIPAGKHVAQPYVSNFSATAICIDVAGNIYVATAISVNDGNGNTFTTGEVEKIPAGGGPAAVVASMPLVPTCMTADAAGNLYVVDGLVQEVPAGGGAAVTLVSDGIPYGVAVDAAGNLYITQNNYNALEKYSRVGGYYMSPFLPPGLTFDETTGIISGTPTTASPATNYIITAYNYGGGSSAAVNITVNPSPLPAISYNSPQTYTAHSAIAPLAPASSGVAAVGYNSGTVLSSGFAKAQSVAADAAGNVYVASIYDNTVTKIPAGGGAPVVLGSGFDAPVGVAVDAAGNVYVADFHYAAGGVPVGEVKEIPAAGGVPVTLSLSITYPTGVAADAAGNVYVTDAVHDVVDQIPAGGGSAKVYATGLSRPDGVCVDAAGNVYVTGIGEVAKIPAGGGLPVTLVNGILPDPKAVAVDAAGDLYVADDQNGAVYKILPGGTIPVPLVSAAGASGVAVDAAGNLYVTAGDNLVEKYKPVGGYYVNAPLPAGLNFDETTGIISGTPAAAGPATNYTVNAYNIGGSAAATVNIKVLESSTDADLSALQISSGTLMPVFAPGITSYTASVLNKETSIAVTPTTRTPGATVNVNGAVLASGTASANIPLNVGPNTITTVVTALDGATTQTYTLTVNRDADATLKGVTLSTGSTPTFSSNNTYTASVSPGTTSLTLTPIASDLNATITVNFVAVKSGTASRSIAINNNPTIIYIQVTGADGVMRKNYTVSVSKNGSSDAGVDLALSTGSTLTRVSSVRRVNDYNASVTAGTNSLTVTPTASDPNATITVDGVAVASGTASQSISIKTNPTLITVKVTAQDGVTFRTNFISVYKNGSSNAGLSVALSTGSMLTYLSSANDVNYYSASVTAGTGSLTVTPTAADPNATITVDGLTVASGTASQSIVIGANPTVITVQLTAQDGTTVRTRSISVYKDGSSDAGFVVSLSTGSPLTYLSGSAQTFYYSASVTAGTTSLTVTPVTKDPNATITVDGIAVTSGTASQSIALNTSPTIITVQETAQDGVTVRTHSISVYQALSPPPALNNADISVTKPADSPAIAEDGILVHPGLSPNGDGINDFLQIDNISQYPDNKLTIMNRNGQLIYEAKGYDNSSKVFDGHSNKNGQMQLPGTYFYQLDYTVSGITKHKTGFIVLKY